MTEDDHPTGPALRRILATPGRPELLDLLAEELSGADLTTLLLEVFRRRAERLAPAEVLRRYRTDRFVAPAPTDHARLRRAEDALIAALPAGFELLTLAPLVPLAAHTAVATVDPRKVVATIRGTEVAADPTNALALEAAHRRAAALAADPRSTAPVRLAASQRVVRAQRFTGPGRLAHFQLFGLVTAGRDTGTHAFERHHLLVHLRFALRALAAAGVSRTELRLTALDPSAAPVLAHLQTELADSPGLDLLEDPDRATGRGYYTDLCYKIHAVVDGLPIEIADGGFTDWTRQLTGNRKERLLIGGFGLDRLADVSPPS
ncbi:hypothetical protein CFP65_7540 [Kitasatospora sp. MMS16-BH015]|uniref:hypothetical protein n=1 Tax=Kitasatospora sp. MMS16-BH015 TaxID=2018025 RepID=UPI000CA1255F|nr:hypothetical protein [Kitasatospora sp. MMS16-BH015]AUG82114.1 hypothetical protein CFP65_7540 [Kitasatospora sp. MMS16-BH015]